MHRLFSSARHHLCGSTLPKPLPSLLQLAASSGLVSTTAAAAGAACACIKFCLGTLLKHHIFKPRFKREQAQKCVQRLSFCCTPPLPSEAGHSRRNSPHCVLPTRTEPRRALASPGQLSKRISRCQLPPRPYLSTVPVSSPINPTGSMRAAVQAMVGESCVLCGMAYFLCPVRGPTAHPKRWHVGRADRDASSL